MDEEFVSVFQEFFSGLIEYTGGSFSVSTWIFTAGIVALSLIILSLIVAKIRRRIKKRQLLESQYKMAWQIVENCSEETFGGPDSVTKEQFHVLAEECVRFGNVIDVYTERKENSFYVSDLCYRMSRQLELSDRECLTNFCAARVYDAGFLDVDQDLFSLEIMSPQEIKLIRTHVLRADNYFDFVPGPLKTEFFNAAYLHHENVNGSGYPESLYGAEIPVLPGLIRVAESYISLTKRRSYHKIVSSEKALSELRSHPEIYNQTVVDALAKVL